MCRSWQNVVIGCGALWSSYILAPNNHYKDAITCLDRGSTFGLNLQVFITHVSTWPPPNNNQLSMEELIFLFQIYAPTCKQINITSYDTPTLTALTSAIDGVNLPRLDVLILNGEGIDFGAPSYLPSPDSFVLSTRGPSTLKLTGLSLNWSVPTFFSHITTLILDHVWPLLTVQDLHCVLHSSTMLARLSFNRIRFAAKLASEDGKATDLDLPQIPLPALEELHMGYSKEVTRITSLIRAPRLHSFQVGFTNNNDLWALRPCAELLSSVTLLMIEGSDSERWAPAIHAVMPNLTAIDLTWASYHLFRTMARDAVNLWPNLQIVSASDVRYKDMRKLLDARSPHCAKLDELNIHYSSVHDDEMDHQNVQIIQRQVGRLTLNRNLEYPWYLNTR